MKRMRMVLWMCCAVLMLSPAAQGDTVPSYAGVAHLDPFIPGWPVPPTFAQPGGTGWVLPGDGAVPDPEYDVVGPIATSIRIGSIDGVVGGPWICEHQFDFDPWGGVGPFLLTVTFPAAGMSMGPYLVTPAAGWDVWVVTTWPDMPEVGLLAVGTCTNLTTKPIGWGVSAVEDPVNPAPVNFKLILPDGEHEQFIPQYEGYNWEVRETAPDTYELFLVPEPATLSLLAVGLGAMTARRRWRR